VAPVLPVTKDAVSNLDEVRKAAERVGYPVILKQRLEAADAA